MKIKASMWKYTPEYSERTKDSYEQILYKEYQNDSQIILNGVK